MRIFNSPASYIQGPDALAQLAQLVQPLGTSAFVVTTSSGAQLVKKTIQNSFEGSTATCSFCIFDGECCTEAIERCAAEARAAGSDVVVGVGGGKALDVAKAIAHTLNVPVVVCPTAASSDAPTSTLSAIYTPEGAFDHYLHLRRAPDMVVLDTTVIAAAPVRLMVAGMGDALSTYFEARATAQAEGTTSAGGAPAQAALALAHLAFTILMDKGAAAKADLEAGRHTQAVEDIIEANTLLSGLGFESGGLAAAHAIHNGLTLLPETSGTLHGEKVAFGTLAQLMLEQAPAEELERVARFCMAVGLPATLEELGITDTSPEHLAAVAERACTVGGTMRNMPIAVTPAMVIDALRAADAYGRRQREQMDAIQLT